MPPSTMSAKEAEAFKNKLEETRDRVKGNKEEAIRILHAAGITDKRGKLTAPYRSTSK